MNSQNWSQLLISVVKFATVCFNDQLSIFGSLQGSRTSFTRRELYPCPNIHSTTLQIIINAKLNTKAIKLIPMIFASFFYVLLAAILACAFYLTDNNARNFDNRYIIKDVFKQSKLKFYASATIAAFSQIGQQPSALLPILLSVTCPSNWISNRNAFSLLLRCYSEVQPVVDDQIAWNLS